MSRVAGVRPADIARDNRQTIWDALRKSDGAWMTLSDLSEAVGVHRRTAMDYLTCLTAGGLIESRRPDGGAAALEARLLRDVGYHAPRLRKDGSAVTQGAGVTNMWRTMRMLGTFGAVEVSLHSTTPTVTVPVETAQSYCSMLLATGYLRVVTKADPVKGRKAVYRLIRDDGPKAPMIQRVKQVYDPNTRKVYRKAGQE